MIMVMSTREMASDRLSLPTRNHWRILLPTEGLDFGTAGVEMATGRPVDRARNLSGQRCRNLLVGNRLWHGRQQRLGVGVRRPVENLRLFPHLDDASQVHDGNAIA